jgi:Immunity protein 52
MNYFANSIQLPPIPNEFTLENYNAIGKLLITTKDDFDAVNNTEHYSKANKIVKLFREYNILRPK